MRLSKSEERYVPGGGVEPPFLRLLLTPTPEHLTAGLAKANMLDERGS